jgi:hypothetical protein
MARKNERSLSSGQELMHLDMMISNKLGITIALCALSVLSFEFNLPKNCTHSAHSRGCWANGFNILTDYHDVANIPPGKLVEVRSICIYIYIFSDFA